MPGKFSLKILVGAIKPWDARWLVSGDGRHVALRKDFRGYGPAAKCPQADAQPALLSVSFRYFQTSRRLCEMKTMHGLSAREAATCFFQRRSSLRRKLCGHLCDVSGSILPAEAALLCGSFLARRGLLTGERMMRTALQENKSILSERLEKVLIWADLALPDVVWATLTARNRPIG